MDLMLARIEGCAGILSHGPDPRTPVDVAIEQVLLADLGLVTAYLRGQTDDLSARLGEAAADLCEAESELGESLPVDPSRPAEQAASGDDAKAALDTLTVLGIRHGTDKAFHHGFTAAYNSVLEPVRFDVKSLLEIGVCKGRSIRMWLDYLPNARIACIDSMDVASFVRGLDRVEFQQCAQSEYRTDQVFDVIVDDGSHLLKDQQDTFVNLLNNWSRCYILEDLHTSSLAEYGFDGTNSTIDFLREFQRQHEADFHVEIVEARNGSITSIITRR